MAGITPTAISFHLVGNKLPGYALTSQFLRGFKATIPADDR